MADEDQSEDMEDGEESLEGDIGEDGEGKKGGKKKLLLIAVPLLLIIGGGAGAYFTGMLDSFLGKTEATDSGHADEAGGAEHKTANAASGGEHGEGAGAEGESSFLEIPPMVVNLAEDEDGTPRYLRLTVQLELADPSQNEQVKAVIPRVIDQFQTYLRELRVRDLRGSAGIYRLHMELLWRVNQAAYPAEIKDVLFQEILIQ